MWARHEGNAPIKASAIRIKGQTNEMKDKCSLMWVKVFKKKSLLFICTANRTRFGEMTHHFVLPTCSLFSFLFFQLFIVSLLIN